MVFFFNQMLVDNDLRSAGCKALCKALQENATLVTLDLSGIDATGDAIDASFFACFKLALPVNRNVKFPFSFEGNGFKDSDGQYFFELLQVLHPKKNRPHIVD